MEEAIMDERQAVQLLIDIRKPLLTLHKAILDHERASYEKEFGATTPAAFLQVLITGSTFRWLAPLSTVIANVDETLDDKDASAAARIASAQTVIKLFAANPPHSAFLERYLPLLQSSPEILHEHGRVAQILQAAGS
jgi:hypothetical protein